MQLPPLELIDDAHLYLSGEIVVHPSAVIAPGVLMQADPGCRLVIGSGVCIGAGTILHAHQGHLEIAAGAILGTGVLLIGRGTIGANACIGSQTTIFNSSVLAHQSIPPQSLIGDLSRTVVLTDTFVDAPTSPIATSEPKIPPVVPPTPDFKASTPDSNSSTSPASDPIPSGFPSHSAPNDTSSTSNTSNNGRAPAPIPTPSVPTPKSMTQVYGQAYVQRIMMTMFPHRQLLNSDPDAGPSSSDDVPLDSSPPRDPPTNSP